VLVNRPRTRHTTLHRLVPGVRPDHDGMFDAYSAYVSAQRLDELGAQLEFIDVAGAPAVWIGVQADTDVAGWCADASLTTGLDLAYTDCRSAGVLLLGVDQVAYALSYGNGHLLVPDELKDQRFGLRFLIRRLRPSPGPGAPPTRCPGPNRLHAGPCGSACLDPRDRGKRGDHQADRRPR